MREAVEVARDAMRGVRGEANRSAKLTAEIVREIRASSDTGQELARHYGVSGCTISLVRRRLRWRHI